MIFFSSAQPIALPADSEDDQLLRAEKQVDPEVAVDVPQQQQCGRRCCFKKGSRGRKAVRLAGHLVILGAFFYWLWGPPVRFHFDKGQEFHGMELSDFTDIDQVPATVPKDFLWAPFYSDEKLECDTYAEWSEPKKIKHPCKGPHHGHRKPHHPDEPKHPHHPGGPEPPHHPGGPEPPHHPGGPEPPHHPGGPEPPHRPDDPEPPRHPDDPEPPHHPDHPHKPDHPHWPGLPHRPDHPHEPGHPHKPHHPHKRPPGPKYTSDATFKLPLSDSALLFYSHGPFAFGGIKFYQDDSDSLKSNEVEVTINAKIWDKAALELSKVCTLKRDHGSGLGIWTEPVRHKKPEERKKRELILRISVKFPKHPDTFELKKLQTHMPLFAHFFKDSNLKVNELEVASFFFPVKSEALTVDRGHIKTENNVIVGNFTATDILVIETKNSPVAVNVTLKNDPEKEFDGEGREHTKFSKLFIHTSNGPVHGNISLVSTAKDHSGGKFMVGARTSNAPLHIGFADAPVDSVLHFSEFTTNAPAIAVMHPTYQGDFLVKSSLFGPRLEVKSDVKDPAGEGRTRTVDFARVGKEIVGKVFWGSEEESKDAFGRVEIGTTLLRAVLKL